MTPRIHAISLSHQTAPIGVRDRLSVSEDRAGAIVHRFACRFGEAALLRTCGRLELYVATIGHGRVLDSFASAFGASRALLAPFVRQFDEVAATGHLMEVASGLRSPLPGEHHILGQVRAAALFAQDAGTSGPLLTTLFQSAIRCGRRVRNETPIGRLAHTYANAAMHALRGRLTTESNVLIVGSGTLANEIARGLRAERVANLTIASRHPSRGLELARSVGADWHSVDDVARCVCRADAVVCCTSSRRTLIDAGDIPADDRRRTFVDLGMPRNVDARIGMLPNATLIDLDNLSGAVAIAAECKVAANAVISEEAARFGAWLTRRRAYYAAGRFSSAPDLAIRDEVAA